MDTVKIIELSSGKEVLNSSFIRLSVNDGMVAIMLDGKLNSQARALSTTKLYKITINQNEEQIMEAFSNFISYHFIYMNVESEPNLAVGDNTILMKILE